MNKPNPEKPIVAYEEKVTVGIGTNRMILAHQLLDMIETRRAYNEREALSMLGAVYGILIEITGRPTMAEQHPELVNKVVEFENFKRDIERAESDGNELGSSAKPNGGDGSR